MFGSRFSTILSIGALVSFLLSSKLRNFRFNFKSIIIATIIFLFASIPAIYNGEFFSFSYVSSCINIFFVPLYIGVLIDTPKKFDKLINILIITGMIVSLVSFTELFKFNIFSILDTKGSSSPGESPVSGVRFGIYRLESGLGQSIAYAIYLTIIILLIFYKLLHKENLANKSQNIYLFFLMVLNACLFLTVSRVPIMICAFLEFLLFFKLPKKSKCKIAAFLGVALFIAIFSIVFIEKSFVYAFFDNILGIFKGDIPLEDNPFYYRLNLFVNIGKVLKGHWIFGIGLRANSLFSYPSLYYGQGVFMSSSFDNGYLSYLITYGIVGLFSLAILSMWALSKCVELMTKKNDLYKIIFVLIMFAVLINLFSVSAMDERKLIMIILGSIFAYDKIKQDYFSYQIEIRALEI